MSESITRFVTQKAEPHKELKVSLEKRPDGTVHVKVGDWYIFTFQPGVTPVVSRSSGISEELGFALDKSGKVIFVDEEATDA